jgi:DNA-binding transcriptional MocR family regulator
MIDLTGPLRPWSAALRLRFARAQDRSLHTGSWWRPPAPRGEPALLARLADLFGVPAERTAVTNGVRQFASSYVGQAGHAVVETPTFADIPRILATTRPVRTVPWEALREGDLGDDRPRTVWLTSPFRNPDGRCLDPRLRDELDSLAAKGHKVIVNQVYRWFQPEPTATPMAPPRAWTVTSLAKLAGGGVRLGWATAPASSEITAEQTLTSGSPPTAWQRTWAEFLDAPTFRAMWSDCVEPTIDAQRAFAERIAELLGWEIADLCPSILVECVDVAEKEAIELLEQRGTRVSPGSAFNSPVPSVRLAFSGTTVAEATQAADHIAGLPARLRPWAERP